MAYTTIKKPSDYFNTKLYTGTATSAGNTQAITGVGFQPDWVWIKNRGGSYQHVLYDAVRGVNKEVRSSQDIAEVDSGANGYLSGFDSDGFTTNAGTNEGNHVNNTGDNYASWNWLANGTGSANTDGSINSTVSANTTSGFSIVKYTGNETSGATVGHGLSTTPKMIIIKNRNSTDDWVVYHESLGNTQSIRLNLTNAAATTAASFNNTSPTSSVFTLGDWTAVNGSSMIAYCFAEKTGYSKFGSYTGNGSTDGTFVYTGFKPAFVMVKRSSGTDNWMITDNKRSSSGGNNVIDRRILPNISNAEYTNTSPMDILSNGFKHRDGDDINNASGSTYIYMAFAEQPLIGDNPATAR